MAAPPPRDPELHRAAHYEAFAALHNDEVLTREAIAASLLRRYDVSHRLLTRLFAAGVLLTRYARLKAENKAFDACEYFAFWRVNLFLPAFSRGIG